MYILYLCSYRWGNSNWRKVHSQGSKCHKTNYGIYIPWFVKLIVDSNVTFMEANLITVWQHSTSVEARKMASQATGMGYTIWRVLYSLPIVWLLFPDFTLCEGRDLGTLVRSGDIGAISWSLTPILLLVIILTISDIFIVLAAKDY